MPNKTSSSLGIIGKDKFVISLSEKEGQRRA
jgi:hypothetical protein